MCFNCFVISGDANLPEWQQWSDHPVRKEYDILMDLGEGAFSQVQGRQLSLSILVSQRCLIDLKISHQRGAMPLRWSLGRARRIQACM